MICYVCGTSMTCLKTHNLQVRPADWNKVTHQHNKLTVILLFKLLQTTGENFFIDVKIFLLTKKPLNIVFLMNYRYKVGKQPRYLDSMLIYNFLIFYVQRFS